MYKVFFKESCFLLTDQKKWDENKYSIYIHYEADQTKAYIRQQLHKEEVFHAVIYHHDPEVLLSVFKSCFFYVKAAGGAVCENGRILIIKRLGMTDLPKGHIEANESIEAGAIREVEEECGIRQVRIVMPIDSTLHIYPHREEWYLKKTYWFMMTCSPGQHPVPQREEGIEEVYWIPISEIGNILPDTYPSLRPVLLYLQAQ